SSSLSWWRAIKRRCGETRCAGAGHGLSCHARCSNNAMAAALIASICGIARSAHPDRRSAAFGWARCPSEQPQTLLTLSRRRRIEAALSPTLPASFRKILCWGGPGRTVTGRVGYGFDPWLRYVKGGFAAGNVETSIQTNPFGVMSQGSAVHSGWTLGGGVEFKVAPQFSLGLEFMHTDLGRSNDI